MPQDPQTRGCELGTTCHDTVKHERMDTREWCSVLHAHSYSPIRALLNDISCPLPSIRTSKLLSWTCVPRRPRSSIWSVPPRRPSCSQACRLCPQSSLRQSLRSWPAATPLPFSSERSHRQQRCGILQDSAQ